MAEVKEEYIIDLNRLNFGGSGRPQGMYFQGEVNQAYFGGAKVFNRALYHMEAPWDGYLSTDAGPFDLKNMLANFNFSWKKDLAGTNKDVQEAVEWYMEDPSQEVLPGNTDENNAKDTEFTLTQYLSGLQVTGLVRQDKDRELRTEYRDVEITDVKYPMDAPAAGFDNIPLLVSFSGYKLPVWASGKEATAVPWGGTVRSGFLALTGRSLSDDVSFDSSTGEVDAPYLADMPMDARQIAVVTYVKISTDAGELEWSGEAYLIQEANVKSNDGDPVYKIKSFPSSYEVPGEETYIYIHIDYAYKTQYIKWTSGYEDSETEDTYVRLRASEGTLDDTILYGVNYTILHIPQNGSSERTITVRVYNTAAGYDVTHTITQEAYEEKEVWQAPFISGTVSVDEIPADGSGALLNATVIQYKKKGDSIIQTYYPSITALVGTAVSGTGYSYSNGVIYASSMGTTEYKNGRKVFTITKLTVVGGDGKEYNLALSSSLEVWQASNTFDFQGYGSYVFALSANPSKGLAAAGDTSTITASAQIEKIYEWSSGDGRDVQLSNVNANLSVSPTSAGYITPTSITGEDQTAELTVYENPNTSDRNIVVAMKSNDNSYSKTHTVTQSKTTYTLANVSSSNSVEIESTTTSFSIHVESSKNGNPLAITPSCISFTGISGISSSNINVVQDTYYKNRYHISIIIGASSNGRSFSVKVTQPESGYYVNFNVTQKSETSSDPDGVLVIKRSGDWILGTVNSGQMAGTGTNQVPIYYLVVVKKTPITSASTATYNLYYRIVDVSTGTIGDEKSFNGTRNIASGETIEVNGVEYYGSKTPLLVGPGLSVRATTFSVS